MKIDAEEILNMLKEHKNEHGVTCNYSDEAIDSLKTIMMFIGEEIQKKENKKTMSHTSIFMAGLFPMLTASMLKILIEYGIKKDKEKEAVDQFFESSVDFYHLFRKEKLI